MYRYFLLLLAVVGLFGLSACKDEDDPFVGSDNYIHEFTLSIEGKSYEGYISNEVIEFVFPAGTELKGAKATANICENATISPEPSAVSAWGAEDQRFTVTAYNGETREYKVVIKYETVSYDGNVVLNTQAEVDAFAKQEIKIVNGYLKLGTDVKEGADSIKNLSGVSNIVKVKNSIIIGKGMAIKSIDGFTSLKEAANIYLGSEKAPVTLSDSLDIEFPQLESVGEIALSANLLRSVRLPKVSIAYQIFINSSGVKSVEIPQLESVFSGVTVQGSIDGKTLNGKVESLGLGNLQQAGGLTITGLSSLKEIAIPKLKVVEGDLNCSKFSNIEKIEFPELTSVSGSLSLSSYNECKTISLPKIESVGGSLTIKGEYRGRFPEVLDVKSLKTVKEAVLFQYLGVKDLDLSNLETVGKSMEFSYVSSMENLLTPKLSSAGENFDISCCDAVKDIDIDQLNASKISLTFIYNVEKISLPKEIETFVFNAKSMKAFPQITGGEKIKTFLLKDGDLESLTFTEIKEIDSLYANQGSYKYLSFPELKSVRAINYCQYNLKKFSAPKLEVIGKAEFEFMWLAEYEFPSLKEITGEFKFWGASSKYSAGSCTITDLNGFSSVQKIGSVYIRWCPKLNDFSAFKNALPSLTEDKWKVEECMYNPTYQDMLDGKFKM